LGHGRKSLYYQHACLLLLSVRTFIQHGSDIVSKFNIVCLSVCLSVCLFVCLLPNDNIINGPGQAPRCVLPLDVEKVIQFHGSIVAFSFKIIRIEKNLGVNMEPKILPGLMYNEPKFKSRVRHDSCKFSPNLLKCIFHTRVQNFLISLVAIVFQAHHKD